MRKLKTNKNNEDMMVKGYNDYVKEQNNKIIGVISISVLTLLYGYLTTHKWCYMEEHEALLFFFI